VVRPGGRLVLFHPSGRAALAARHGRRPRDDDLLAPGPLRHQLQRAGWRPARYDDDGQWAAARVKLSMPVEVKSIAGSTLGQARTSSQEAASGRSKAA
jgi:hypothetical protein